MNLAHVHLLLNHFPTVGFAIGLGLFVVAIAGKNEELKRASLIIFFLIALIAIPTYVTGNAAEAAIESREGVSAALINAHESAALIGFIFMEITGFMAWLGLWQSPRISPLARWNIPVVLVFSIVTFGFMARAANMAGEIRHPEILGIEGAAATGEEAASGVAASLGTWVMGNAWAWPACETLHFIGLCVLFTVVLLVDLRMLGMGKNVPFSSLYQLLPLGMLGFGLNLMTGMVFFVTTPSQYTDNLAFHWKIVFVMLGGINVLYFMLSEEPWKVGSGDDAPLKTKCVAASAIFLWLGVLYFGHMLPFIGNAF